MKLREITTGAHGLKQFTFRLNEKEVEALLVVIDLARAYVPKAPTSAPLMAVRKNVNIANRELKRALVELEKPS